MDIKNLYPMIFKRKSFHLFKETLPFEENDKTNIISFFDKLEPLIKDIKIEIKLVDNDQVNKNRGQSAWILFYSEKKDNYLANIGYIGEQLDLYLTSLNIATLWFGIGSPKELVYNNLDFVIMMGIAKTKDTMFRTDMYKSKRKNIEEIWQGDDDYNISNIIRFAPSACNTQPWLVKSTKTNNNLLYEVYRYKNPKKRGIMPTKKVIYYNRIDIGIFLLFIELCLLNQNIEFTKELFIDNTDEIIEYTLVSKYFLRKDLTDGNNQNN